MGISVYVVSADLIRREGIRSLVESYEDCSVGGDAETIDILLDTVIQPTPTVLIVDIRKLDCVDELTRRLNDRHRPGVRVLVCDPPHIPP